MNFLKSIRLKEEVCCSICLIDLVAPCQITILGCNPHHIFHQECAQQWINHSKEKSMIPGCPMCRVNIDESRMENSNYKGIEGRAGSVRTKEKLAQDKKEELDDMFGGALAEPVMPNLK